MKYLIQTIKYLKSNLLLLPSLAIAVMCFAVIVDYTAAETVIDSYGAGYITDSFTDWFKLFIPFNSKSWITILLSIAAYVLLVLNVAFVHSMVDKHVRFGSKSFRSVMSSFTINFVYGLITMLVIAAACLVMALLLAVVMKTFAMPGAYIFIIGAVICAVLAALFIFIGAHFFLWLPCAEITGYKMSEALYCSYAQARTVRWTNTVAIALPLALSVVTVSLFGAFLGTVAAIISGAVCFGCSYMLIVVASYMAYADVENIEREDLRKY